MAIIAVKIGMMRNYLLKLNEGYLLIDVSWSRYYKRFKRKLKKLQIPISEIKYLLITHSHTDHTGFAEKLLTESGAKLITHEKALPLLKKGEMETEAEPTNRAMRFMYRLVHKIIAASYPGINISDEVIIVKKNDETPIPKDFGLKGKIVDTPGHTFDSITLVLEDGKGFTGDLCTNFFLFRLMGLGRNPPLNVGKEHVQKSWKKLGENGVKIIYPAHGKPFPIEKLRIQH